MGINNFCLPPDAKSICRPMKWLDLRYSRKIRSFFKNTSSRPLKIGSFSMKLSIPKFTVTKLQKMRMSPGFTISKSLSIQQANTSFTLYSSKRWYMPNHFIFRFLSNKVNNLKRTLLKKRQRSNKGRGESKNRKNGFSSKRWENNRRRSKREKKPKEEQRRPWKSIWKSNKSPKCDKYKREKPGGNYKQAEVSI